MTLFEGLVIYFLAIITRFQQIKCEKFTFDIINKYYNTLFYELSYNNC